MRAPTRPDAPTTISAVSELLGVPIPTIRSWERRYGFPSPHRTRGRHRRYSLREIELLRALRDEITRGHPAREAVRRVAGREAGGAPRRAYVDQVLGAAIRLDPTTLRQTLDEAAQALAVETAIQEVALPAMREIGNRWRVGDCDVAQEHLATDGVRSWLARLSAMAPPPFRGRTLVLACGPKELHSIGLEAFGVLLARQGWGVRVLGPMTPVEALTTAVRASKADGAIITSQRSVTRRAAIEAIGAVAGIPGVSTFFAGDAFAAASVRRGVPGVYLGTDLLEAVRVVERALLPRPRPRRRPTRVLRR